MAAQREGIYVPGFAVFFDLEQDAACQTLVQALSGLDEIMMEKDEKKKKKKENSGILDFFLKAHMEYIDQILQTGE